MVTKTILVPIENDDAVRWGLTTTLASGRRFGSYIEGGASCWTSGEAGAVDMIGGALLEKREQQKAEAFEKAWKYFDSFMQKHGVSRSNCPDGFFVAADVTRLFHQHDSSRW